VHEYQDFYLIVEAKPSEYKVEAYARSGSSEPVNLIPGNTRAGHRITASRMLSPSCERAKSVAARSLRRSFRPHQHRVCHARPRCSGVNLRLKLIIRPPELSHLPWNCCTNTDDVFSWRLACISHRALCGKQPAGCVAPGQAPAARAVRAGQSQGYSASTWLASEKASANRSVRRLTERCAPRRRTPCARRCARLPGFHILHYDAMRLRCPAAVGSLGSTMAGGIHSLSGEMLRLISTDDDPPVVLSACETATDSSKTLCGHRTAIAERPRPRRRMQIRLRPSVAYCVRCPQAFFCFESVAVSQRQHDRRISSRRDKPPASRR